jgi:hypothetical protein
MNVFDAILALSRASWQVLRRHRRLAWFPLIELAVGIVVAVLVALLFGPPDGPSEVPWRMLLAMLVALQLVQVFFSVALTSEALKALRGESPAVGAGLEVAAARLPAIVPFAAITGPVGFVLGAMGRSSRGAVRFARAVFGTAWSLVTFLAIPVMVQERRGGIASLRRSGELFRRTWGETALSEVGVRVVAAHVVTVLVILAIVLIRLFGDSRLVVLALIAGATAVVCVVSALEAIYRAALYVFAAEGVVPEPFGGPELEEIWQVK